MATTENIISLMTNNHQALRKLLGTLIETSEKDAEKRKSILIETIAAVRAHMKTEEELFYPAFLVAMKSREDRTIFYAAIEEHRILDIVLVGIQTTDPAEMEFSGRIKVLRDLVEHHAGEEEKEMFVRAQVVIPESTLLELGSQMEIRQAQTAAA